MVYLQRMLKKHPGLRSVMSVLLSIAMVLSSTPITALAEGGYTYTVTTYNFDGTMEGISGLSDYYVRALIKDKASGNYVAGDVVPIDLSSSPTSVELNFYSDPYGSRPSHTYDSENESLEIRVVHPSSQYYNPLSQGNWAAVQGDDAVSSAAPDGYSWKNGSIGDTAGSVELWASKPVKYNVRVQFDNDAIQPKSGDGLYALVTIEHETTGNTYGLVEVASGSKTVDGDKTSYDIPVTSWYSDTAGTQPKDEKFTGNEKKVSVKLVAKDSNGQYYDIPSDGVVNDSNVASYPSTESNGPSTGRTSDESDPSFDKVYDTVVLSSNSTAKLADEDYSLEYVLSGYNYVMLCDPASGKTHTNNGHTYRDGDLVMDTHCMGGVLVRGNVSGGATGFADDGGLTKSSVIGGTTTLAANTRVANDNPPDLYIGPDNTLYGVQVNADQGDVANGKYYGGGLNKKQQSKGQTYVTSSYIDWDKLQDAIKQTSSDLSDLTEKDADPIDITYDGQVIEVEQGSVVTVNNPNNYYYLVNVVSTTKSGQDQVATVINDVSGGSRKVPSVASYCGEALTGAEASHPMEVIFNFPNAEELTMHGEGYIGHYVAPNADVVDYGNSQFNGTIVANSGATNSEGHMWPLTQKIQGRIKLGKLVTLNDKATTDERLDGDYEFTISSEGVSKQVVIKIKDGNTVSATVDGEDVELDDSMVWVYWIPRGEYTIEEVDPDNQTKVSKITVDGIEMGDVDARTVEFSLEEGESKDVLFTNNLEETSLKLTKLVTVNNEETTTDRADGSYTFTLTKDDEATAKTIVIKVENGQAVSATIDGKEAELKDGAITVSGLSAGNYTLSETDPNNGTKVKQIAGAAVQSSDLSEREATITLEDKKTGEVTYTNDLGLGSLKVTKSVDGPTDAADKAFRVTVKVSTTDGDKYVADTDGNLANQPVELTVSQSTPLVISNLPADAAFTVTETETGRTIEGWTFKEDGSTTTGEGTISEGKTATVALTNKYDEVEGKGILTVKKTVSAPDSLELNELPTYEFTVTNESGAYLNTDGTTSEDEVKHSVSYNQTITFNDVTPGTYTVTELGTGENGTAQITRYTLVASAADGESVTVEANDTAAVTLTNTYTEKPGSLTVTKAIDGTDVAGSYQIRLKNAEGTYFDLAGNEVAADQAYVTFAADESKTWENLPAGTYTIEEADANADDYEWTVLGATDVVVNFGADTAVTVTNKYVRDAGRLEVTKAVEGNLSNDAIPASFSFVVKQGDKYVTASGELVAVETVHTVANGGTVVFDNLPTGSYTVTELGTDENGGAQVTHYTLTASATDDGDVTVAKSETATVTLTNTYTEKPGSLTVTKAVEAPEGVGADSYQIRVKNAEGTYFDLEGNEVAADQAYVTFAADESKTWENLPAGTYTIEENTDAAEVENYTLSVDGTGDVTVDIDAEATATVTNTYTENASSLKIKKTFVGVPEGTDVSGLAFEVVGPKGMLRLTYADFDENGEYLVGNDLQVGDTYTVTETNADTLIGNYSLVADDSTTSGEATISHEPATIALTNTYQQDTGSVKITKTFDGAPEGADLSGLTFEVTKPDGTTENHTYAEFTNGELVIAENVPVGGTYQVRETNAGSLIAGYQLKTSDSTTTGSATVAKDETKTIALTNTYEQITGSLQVTKTVSGIAATDAAGLLASTSTTFTVTVQNADGLYVQDAEGTLGADEHKFEVSASSPLSISNLPVGTYTVAETGQNAIDGYVFKSVAMTPTTGEATITSMGDEATVKLTNTYEQTSVKVSKTDVASGEELEGAKIQILDSEDNVVEEWTSGSEAHEVKGLKVGEEYTLKETVAPDGYTIASDTKFTIDETGKVTVAEGGTQAQDGTILIEDSLTHITVSKKAVDGSEELAGATIQILDKETGEVVELNGETLEWTSGREAKVIEGLPTGKTYTLHEDLAPAGYAVASDIDFVINEDGTVTAGDKSVEGGALLIEDALTEVRVSKTDITGAEEVAGAKIQILDAEGNVAKDKDGNKLEWTSTEEAKVITGLKADETYTLHEETAPDGYIVAADTTFTIAKDGTVTTEATTVKDKDGNDVILVQDAKTVIRVSKTDLGTGEELEGAKIQIKDSEGTVVAEWTSGQNGEKVHVVEGILKTGETYTLVETVAPEGYTVTSETTFTLDEQGNLTNVSSTSKDENGNDVILIKDSQTVVRVSKTDIADGKEVAGAKIQIKDADGNVVKEWTSDGKNDEVIKGLKTGVEYTLHEETAPEGYTIASDTTFTIDSTGKVTATGNTTTDGEGNLVLLVEDSQTVVKVSKTDVASGEELEGAKIQIVDSKGTVVEEWTSTTEAHEVTGLKTGEEYTLKETVAPDGYTIASETTFTIDETGKVTTTGTTTTDEDGNTVLLVEDSQTVVKVSKTDVASGEELEGAKIQIVDSKGTVVEEWTSTTEAHEVTGLKTGEEYTLHEEVAPEGYTVATDTTFTIDETGKVTTTGTITEDGVLLVEDSKTSVRIAKTDVTDEDNKEIAGATIQIIEQVTDEEGNAKDGEIFATWTSKEGEAEVVEGLKTNTTYILRETTAPDGYTVTADTTFTIGEDGKVTTEATTVKDEDGNDVILVQDAKTKVSVKKTDLGTGEEVEGAKITLLDKDGNEVESWTSTKDAHEIEGLSTGEEYTLHEEVAPDGYTIATDTKFTIDESGKVTVTEGSQDEDGTILIEDAKTVVRVSKTDVASGEELEGAKIQIVDSKGTVVEEWTSTTEAHEVTGLKTGEEYTLKETVAPDGYTIASETTFTIDETGKVTTTGTTTTDEDGNTVLLVEDAKTKVTISKTDVADGKELEGATIQILDSKGNVVDEWTSTKEAHEVEGLNTDEEYTLKETVAPEGYAVTTETTFTIDETGKVTTTGTKTVDEETGKETLLVEDSKTSIKVSKTDVASGDEVEGAKIQIKDADGNVVDEWTSTKEAHEVKGLKTGVTYTLHEEVAPDGYAIATDTTFSIAADGTVIAQSATIKEGVLLVEDAKTKVTVKKTDIASGEELEGAKIQIVDSEGNVFDEWTSTKEAHEVEGLKTGEEYTLKETVAPEGYAITTETTFTLDETGKVTSATGKHNGNELLVEDAKTVVRISKTDITDEEEVEGAVIQILNAEGAVVDEWTSTTEAHVKEGLKTGVKYTLVEKTAPAGYTVAAKTFFTIHENGKVDYSGTTVLDENDNKVMLIKDSLTKVSIKKTDLDTGEELEGAHIVVKDAKGNVVDEWTSTKEAHVIEGKLNVGETYTFEETTAPAGYKVTAKTTFTLDENGKVTSDATVTDDGVLLVEDELTSVKVSKTDLGTGEEVEGAHIQILDKHGNVVVINDEKVEWTSTTEAHEVTGLKTGEEYTLHEEVAPDGYTIATDTKFTIDETGKVTTTGTITEDGVLLVEDAKTVVRVSKTDIASGEELEGAKIVIKDAEGNEVESWTSAKEAHVVEGLKVGEEYTLEETTAPDGYKVTASTKFTIDETGKVDYSGTTTTDEDGNEVMLVEDEMTKVSVKKTDLGTGEEVEGAKITLLDKDGNEVESWTSAKEAHTIEGLKTGEEYTLRETVAPEGYTVTTDITFTIGEDGKVTTGAKTEKDADGNDVILVEDAKTKVSVKKTDLGTGEEVEGAKITLLDKDGNEVESWTSGKEAHEVEGLKTGEEYTLREQTAPTGYVITTDITFTIDETGKVTTGAKTEKDEDGNDVILVEDAQTIKVKKTDLGNGEELEGATIVIKDSEGNVVDEWTSTKEAHEVEGLKTGEEYTLEETTAPDGYKVTEKTTFTIDEKGNVTTTNKTTTDEDGKTVILVEDEKTKVTISKTDLGTGEELEGAKIQIKDAEGNVVEEWTSTKEAHVVEGLKTGEEYTLEETTAPDGYKVTAKTTFTIDEKGKVTTTGSTTTDEDGNEVLLVEDEMTKVSVKKTDIASGEELEGATIQILDEDGNVVEEWTSTKEAHEVTGLVTGKTYTLKETVAPEGYTIATETTFSISATGTVTSSGTVTDDGILLVEDAQTSVALSKRDIDTGEELAGCQIQIIELGEDGTEGETVVDWTSTEDEPIHVVKGLKTGVTYLMREVAAPEGYLLTTDATFTIATDGTVSVTGAKTTTDEDGNTVVLCEDTITSVDVKKVDTDDHKEVLDGAVLQVKDANGVVVDKWTTTTGAHTIEGLTAGETYTLHEAKRPYGYELADDITFVIEDNGDGTATIKTTATMDGDATILMEDDITEWYAKKKEEEEQGKKHEGKEEDDKKKEEGTKTKVKKPSTSSSTKLAKTGDPAAELGMATMWLSGLGSAMVTGGALIRKRRNRK